MSKRSADLEYILRRGVIDIIPEQEFIEALESGRKLRLKFGLDPSKPDLHIGHGVLLRKLRRLQDMGHQVVLIVGDWTARIGDPSGQSLMRPMLTADEVRANAETYMRQFFHVVDREKTEIRWQSEWFDSFTLEDVVRLAARFTVAQMLQREDFRERYDAGKPLGIHELFYPLLQAYDSVAIEADVEFGGSDQRFNLLVGRELQEEMGQRPQVCFIMNLLVGTDGHQKMSKSVRNTIDFEDPPNEQYGKTMSLPDSALIEYLELATDIPDEELEKIRKQIEDGVNPKGFKKRLAWEIVAQFHGEAAAREAETEFERRHERDELPSEPSAEERMAAQLRDLFEQEGGKLRIREVSRSYKELLVPFSHPAGLDLPTLSRILAASGLVASISQARRLVREGAIELNGKRLMDEHDYWSDDFVDGAVIRVGKHRFLRIVDADMV
ncbi:MAG: tyrosine--tRNA ligase [Dehalococcoidia bacterium]